MWNGELHRALTNLSGGSPCPISINLLWNRPISETVRYRHVLCASSVAPISLMVRSMGSSAG